MTIRITEADLPAFMRERRYWQPGHPERQRFAAWVTQGWKDLHAAPGGGKDGSVWIKPYTRNRDGQTEEVEGHWRSAPAGKGLLSETQEERKRRKPKDGERGRDGTEIQNLEGETPGTPAVFPAIWTTGETADDGPSDPQGDGGVILAAKRPTPPSEQEMILEGGPMRGGGGGGGYGGRSTPPATPVEPPFQLPPPGSGAARPGARTPEELRDVSQLGNITSRNTELRRVDGRLPQMSDDFHALTKDRPVIVSRNGVMPGSTADGRPVIARPSSDGRPTIEIQRVPQPNVQSRTMHEYRYGEPNK